MKVGTKVKVFPPYAGYDPIDGVVIRNNQRTFVVQFDGRNDRQGRRTFYYRRGGFGGAHGYGHNMVCRPASEIDDNNEQRVKK